jgi:hypothetical protein
MDFRSICKQNLRGAAIREKMKGDENECLHHRNPLERVRLHAWRGKGGNCGAVNFDQSEFPKQSTHPGEEFA